MKIAVIGAGCGGQAMAGHLASRGAEVSLYNRSFDRIEFLLENPKILLKGKLETQGKINLITTKIEEALEGTELINVVTTANGHYDIAKNMAKHLVDGQSIVLHPGRTFGALEFVNTLLKFGCKADVDVAEANTLIYATRSLEQGISYIHGVKTKVALASIPNKNIHRVLNKINKYYSQFYEDNNILCTSLGNIGAVFHPTIMLMNKERIKNKEKFEFYKDGATRKAVYYMEEMDLERKNIAEKLGVNVQSLKDWLCERYDLKQDSLYDALHSNDSYNNLIAPNSLNTRYITEDVPTGLVPFSEIGKSLGIKTPFIDSLIEDASKELKRNFTKEGRNLSKLGLSKDFLYEDFKRLESINRIQEYVVLQEEFVKQYN